MTARLFGMFSHTIHHHEYRFRTQFTATKCQFLTKINRKVTKSKFFLKIIDKMFGDSIFFYNFAPVIVKMTPNTINNSIKYHF